MRALTEPCPRPHPRQLAGISELWEPPSWAAAISRFAASDRIASYVAAVSLISLMTEPPLSRGSQEAIRVRVERDKGSDQRG
jgi:hypothetical protein